MFVVSVGYLGITNNVYNNNILTVKSTVETMETVMFRNVSMVT